MDGCKPMTILTSMGARDMLDNEWLWVVAFDNAYWILGGGNVRPKPRWVGEIHFIFLVAKKDFEEGQLFDPQASHIYKADIMSAKGILMKS
ncbi:unnamed protein product [Dovyalis caffra]|uniref:Uncharacterized protein n=1 Tax=Dovyalis caffra TaxID=77055 RepID=A0AAV1QQF7_9ROSI|nr:unnamed protein product [Dovyalis caffra]